MPTTTLTIARKRRPASTQRRVASLVQRAAAGDELAWRDLVAEFAGLVWAITRAHRLSDADAAEAAQNTWTRLIEHIDRLHDPGRVGAWLATTARRECLRVLGQAKGVVPVGDAGNDQVADTPDHDAALIDEERDAALWQAFERLRPRHRALLRMLVADPRPSYVEISAALDMPVGSIGPTSARALKQLRRELERLRITGDEWS
ncbi:MAG: RNA polymerase sigma factor [Solirubrobacteraceae bacterium]